MNTTWQETASAVPARCDTCGRTIHSGVLFRRNATTHEQRCMTCPDAPTIEPTDDLTGKLREIHEADSVQWMRHEAREAAYVRKHTYAALLGLAEAAAVYMAVPFPEREYAEVEEAALRDAIAAVRTARDAALGEGE